MTQQPHPAILELAFRPFFLLASFFSLIALTVWALLLSNSHLINSVMPANLWHGHEMLYGFVAAVLVGFLLTAVQNWTGIRSINGKPLLLLVILWLTGRIMMWPDADIVWWLRLVADCSFLLAAALALGRLLYMKRQKRNYFTLLALLILFANNLVFHYAIHTENLSTAAQSLYGSIFLVTMMMAVIGGRVIPMFTGNTTQIPPRPRHRWLDSSGLGLLWILVLIYLLQLQDQLPSVLLVGFFSLSSICLAARCSQWRFMTSFPHPLLWSLHIGNWAIAVGLAFFALHYAGLTAFSTGLHTLTVAAMAGLILSMMSRVSLGHTGRRIVANQTVTTALTLIFIAAIIRVGVASLFPAYSQYGWWLSIVCWIIAFSLFLFRYFSVLTQARVDVQPPS